MFNASFSLRPASSCSGVIDISNAKIPKGLYLPLGKSFIYHSFSPFPFLAQMCNLKPVGTNEKMKGVVTIIALVPQDLWWGHLREEKDNKGKNMPA